MAEASTSSASTRRASMGPASENAGYGAGRNQIDPPLIVLQWVRRPRTPVMVTNSGKPHYFFRASMGPASRTPVMAQFHRAEVIGP